MQANTARDNSAENHACPLDVVRAVYRAYAGRDLAAIQGSTTPTARSTSPTSCPGAANIAATPACSSSSSA